MIGPLFEAFYCYFCRRITFINLREHIFNVKSAILFLSLTLVLLNGYRHLRRCLLVFGGSLWASRVSLRQSNGCFRAGVRINGESLKSIWQSEKSDVKDSSLFSSQEQVAIN